ncbi:MAG: amidohydrolase [Desulfomonile tiedjei]|uniref:Amidohydrolase n=1 Tax=Desulfomonile tiedjei TaxID=2358 RepID=A0A9D6V3G6_9BACT|nr:amidohydrolase [Desulfomonile tiedjei]
MPVLDFHIHLGRRHHLTERLIEYLTKDIGEEALRQADNITPEALSGFLQSQGIRHAVMLAEYTPKTTGIVPNEFVAEFCSQSDQLIPFCSINMQSEEDPGVQVENAVKKLGCRGIKLLPSYAHFYPDDPRILPAYEAASCLGIPVMFHTGTSLFPGSRVRYANPLLLDDVAEDFPNLTIIMCHAGRPFWYAESEWMLRRHRNTYIDIAGIPPNQLPAIFPKLEKLADRFVFGSDWPNFPSIQKQVSLVRELPLRHDIIEAILWENGARLLNLAP